MNGGPIIGMEVVQVRDEATGYLVTGSLHVEDDGTVRFRPVPEAHEGQQALPPPTGRFAEGEETGG